MNQRPSYEDWLDTFKNSCHMYRKQKNEIVSRQGLPVDSVTNQMLKYMEQNIQFVEDYFDKLRLHCDTGAVVILWLLFVEEKTQQEIVYEYGISRRQLRQHVNEWLKKLYEVT